MLDCYSFYNSTENTCLSCNKQLINLKRDVYPRELTLTTPSECPVTMTFCVSHSFISDTQQQRICWLRPVKVLALAMGLPLMLHT